MKGVPEPNKLVPRTEYVDLLTHDEEEHSAALGETERKTCSRDA